MKGRSVAPASPASPRLAEGWLRLALSLSTRGSSFGPSARRLGRHPDLLETIQESSAQLEWSNLTPIFYRPLFQGSAKSFETGWSQGVDATLACSLSAGVRNPKVCRGRVLSRRAISSSSDCENLDRSAFFGRYCRSRPFVFSFEPRCQGLCGSQK